MHHTNDLGDLLNYLNRICDKWFNIGIHLKVDSMKLKEIRSQYPSQSDALREMLIYWLSQKGITWEMIHEAVREPTVNGKPLESSKYLNVFNMLTEESFGLIAPVLPQRDHPNEPTVVIENGPMNTSSSSLPSEQLHSPSQAVSEISTRSEAGQEEAEV